MFKKKNKLEKNINLNQNDLNQNSKKNSKPKIVYYENFEPVNLVDENKLNNNRSNINQNSEEPKNSKYSSVEKPSKHLNLGNIKNLQFNNLEETFEQKIEFEAQHLDNQKSIVEKNSLTNFAYEINQDHNDLNEESSNIENSEKRNYNQTEKVISEIPNHNNSLNSPSTEKPSSLDSNFNKSNIFSKLTINFEKITKLIENLENKTISKNESLDGTFSEIKQQLDTIKEAGIKNNKFSKINAESDMKQIQAMSFILRQFDEYNSENSLEVFEKSMQSVSDNLSENIQTSFSNLINIFETKIESFEKKFENLSDAIKVFEGKIDSFDKLFDKKLLFMIKTFNIEFEKINLKQIKTITSFNEEALLNINLASVNNENTFKQLFVEQNLKVSNLIDATKKIIDYKMNVKVDKYDEYTLNDTIIRVLKWFATKEYVFQSEVSNDESVISSLNYLNNLNIISFGWREDISKDKLPVLAYWINEDNKERIRVLIGKWEFLKLGKTLEISKEAPTKNKKNTSETINLKESKYLK